MMQVLMFPGLESQFKGMGKELFKYKEHTSFTSEIPGYDLEELCVNDPENDLIKTQYTRSALYVVNTFRYYVEIRISDQNQELWKQA